MTIRLEHVNISVRDSRATARLLCDLLGWRIRWQGDPDGKGYSVHVGNDSQYIALYSPAHDMKGEAARYKAYGGLNHIGLVVDDLDAMAEKVRDAGFEITMHADYEPGRRFYFDGPDGVEYELVSYA